ncbi:MAG: hypothetical protein ACI4J4_10645 [Ruminiclostridium sp.]
MEIILGIVVIVLLLLCLGAELGLIAMIFVGVLCGAVLMMLGFFLFSAVRIMTCRKKEAVFCKTEKFPGTKFDRAVYSVDGQECACVFPCEVVMRNRLYRSDKAVNVYYSEKKKYVYDKNAAITVFAGLLSCMALTAAAVIILL